MCTSVYFFIFRLCTKQLHSPSVIYVKDVLEALRLPPGTQKALTTPQCLLLPSSLSHLNSRMYKKAVNPVEVLMLGLKLHSHRQVWEKQVVLPSVTRCWICLASQNKNKSDPASSKRTALFIVRWYLWLGWKKRCIFFIDPKFNCILLYGDTVQHGTVIFSNIWPGLFLKWLTSFKNDLKSKSISQ